MAAGFVTTNHRRFDLDGTEFQVTGVNCYFLAYCAPASREKALQAAKAMGANTVRAWAFLDTETESGGGFQFLKDGVIAVAGLERLDAVIAAAEQNEIKLILPLVNYWKDFGGAPMYLRWLGLDPDPKNFYASLDARLAYRNWVERLLTRRNTCTGRLYSDEPSILGWELTNEARCEGRRDLLLDWVHEMAAFVKSLDRNHLLALGDEGFFGHGFAWKRHGELYDGRHGTDFAEVLDIPEIDFGGYHFYPQDWGHAADLDFAETWIADHAEAGRRADKPVIMEEFGLKLAAEVPDDTARREWFERWLTWVKDTDTAGALLWMLGCSEPDTAGYKDAYTVYLPEQVKLS